MTRKIAVADLRVGMYVQDLNCGWMDHPFLRKEIELTREDQIARIRDAGIREVYIDPARGLDGPGQDAIDAEREIEREMIAFAEAEQPQPRQTSFREEAETAKKIQGEANRLIRDLMQDVRLGRQIDSERIEPVVENITQSILRNGGALLSLCRIKNKDDYTFQHSVSVCGLQTAFCRALQMGHEDIHEAGIGGLLHDIGKTRVADEILNKPGRLTEEEFAQIKCHVVESRRILEQTPGISATAVLVAAQHHERHDGTGYPLGLKGEEISQMGQMAAIVDVYDAITSDRCYHKGLEPNEAMRKIFEWGKFHFNPVLVHAFTRCIGIYPTGSLVRLESDRLAVVIGQCEGNLLQPLVRVIHCARRNRPLPPQELDLSRPGAGGDRILRYEKPEAWGIDIALLLA
ncbi:MAG: HD-GYP domain-containing protein [Burkholderiales bacterium]|nr:HD-GYP domain-containing protein [Burkholderiales bacterium]